MMINGERGNYMNPLLEQIQENMYSLYKFKPQELDPLLGQTYYRKGVDKAGVVHSETYACVVKVTMTDALRLYNEQYNELALTWVKALAPDYPEWRCLTLYSIDDGWWRAVLPITEQPLSLLWSSVLELLTPRATNDCDCWLRFSHRYFLQITKELGATEYDYG